MMAKHWFLRMADFISVPNRICLANFDRTNVFSEDICGFGF